MRVWEFGDDEQISEEFSDAHLLQIRLSSVLGRFEEVAKIVPAVTRRVVTPATSSSSPRRRRTRFYCYNRYASTPIYNIYIPIYLARN